MRMHIVDIGGCPMSLLSACDELKLPYRAMLDKINSGKTFAEARQECAGMAQEPPTRPRLTVMWQGRKIGLYLLSRQLKLPYMRLYTAYKRGQDVEEYVRDLLESTRKRTEKREAKKARKTDVGARKAAQEALHTCYGFSKRIRLKEISPHTFDLEQPILTFRAELDDSRITITAFRRDRPERIWAKRIYTYGGTKCMRIKLDPGAYTPTRAHPTDAGLDIYAMDSGVVKAGQSATFRTGVHVELPRCTYGAITSKSGLMVRNDITTRGTIDESYRGEIMVHLMNAGNEDYAVKRGDKIAQLIIIPLEYVGVEIVDELTQTDRGTSGFGSTGR